MRKFPALDVGIRLRALAVADVPDDAEDPVTVTADDARFVEVLRLRGFERVLELLRLVRLQGAGHCGRESSRDDRRQYVPDRFAEEHLRCDQEIFWVLRMVVDEHALGVQDEHPVRYGAQDGATALLASAQGLHRSLVLDGYAGNVGGGFDEARFLV